jgi:lipopolysaccharide exporter
VRGLFWAYSSYVGGRLLVLVSTAMLARLLTPRDFGVVALALVFTALLETLKDLGVTQALVASPEKDLLRRADTVFILSVLLGIALSMTVAAIAPVAAAFFDEHELVYILPVLGLNFTLRGLGSTHYALAQKRLDFRTRTLAEFADVIVRGLVSIALALAGAGVWAIVIGYVVGTATLNITLWLLVHWRPRFRMDRSEIPGLLRFGGALTAVDVLSAITANVDYIFVGKVIGASTLGLYTLGFRLPELVIVNLSWVAGQVLFPAFANVARPALGHAYLVAFRYMLMISLPLAVAMAILAEPLVLALFGDKWEDAIGPMQVLTVYAFAVAVGIPAGSAYKAIGRADVLLKLAVPRSAMLVAAIAVFVDTGIVAVAACHAAVAGLFSITGLLLASWLLAVEPRRIAVAIWPPLVAAAGMAAGLLLVREVVVSPWPQLIVASVVGGLLYLALIRFFAREALADLREKIAAGRAPRGDPWAVHETDVIA